MRRAKLEGRRIGRAPLKIDRQQVVADRRSGMSLTEVAKKHRVPRATVCRLVNEAGPKKPKTSGLCNRETAAPRPKVGICRPLLNRRFGPPSTATASSHLQTASSKARRAPCLTLRIVENTLPISSNVYQAQALMTSRLLPEKHLNLVPGSLL
jgi:hypothetical protein